MQITGFNVCGINLKSSCEVSSRVFIFSVLTK